MDALKICSTCKSALDKNNIPHMSVYNGLHYLKTPQLLPKLDFMTYIKGGIQAKGIWKQDPEANVWAREGWEWGVEKAPQWGTS